MSDQKVFFDWQNYQESLKSMFSVMRQDSDFADVTLACEDESIKAHQVVLSASSLFFRNLLKTLSHPHPIVYMRGVKADHLSALLDFIYLGNTEITQDLVGDFLLLAEELKVEGLSERKMVPVPVSLHPIGAAAIPIEQSKPPIFEGEPTQEHLQESVIKYCNPATVNDPSKFAWLAKEEGQSPSKSMLATKNELVKSPQKKLKRWRNISEDVLEKIDQMMEKQKNTFYCKVCGYHSKNKGHATEHVEKHIEGLEYPCDTCSKILR